MNAGAVVVTGASGFLGRGVVRRLVADGHIVHGLARRPAELEGLPIDSVNLVDSDELARWAGDRPIDAIVHLAATIPDQPVGEAAEGCFTDNITGTHLVLKLAAERGVPVVQASSASVYGQIAASDGPVAEDRPVTPQHLYPLSKAIGEMRGQQHERESGLPCASLRISSPYGPDNTHHGILQKFLEAALTGRDLTLIGSGERSQDFVFVRDIEEAVAQALAKRASGVFNIGSGTPVSMNELAHLVLESVPGSASKIVWSNDPDPQDSYRARLSIEKARTKLSWSPRCSLREGLERTIRVRMTR